MGNRTFRTATAVIGPILAIAIAAAWQGLQTSNQSSQTSKQSSTQTSQSGTGRASATASSSGSARSSGSQSGSFSGGQGASGSGSGGGFSMSTPPPTHAVTFSPVSGWVERKSWRAQPGFEEHSAYMQRLLKAGKLVYGGP